VSGADSSDCSPVLPGMMLNAPDWRYISLISKTVSQKGNWSGGNAAEYHFSLIHFDRFFFYFSYIFSGQLEFLFWLHVYSIYYWMQMRNGYLLIDSDTVNWRTTSRFFSRDWTFWLFGLSSSIRKRRLRFRPFLCVSVSGRVLVCATTNCASAVVCVFLCNAMP
jgi:hypothetical protein